jgi:hypothetical protein
LDDLGPRLGAALALPSSATYTTIHHDCAVIIIIVVVVVVVIMRWNRL